MRIQAVVFFVLGGAIIAAAFFAEALGLDNDPGWGKGRIAILFSGILIIVLGISYSLYTDKALSIFRQIHFRLSQNFSGLLRFLRHYGYTVPFLVLVILAYVWFASSGSWTGWEPATRYYAELANSFKQGKLHLLDRPSSKLLSLSNPYDPVERQGVDFFIDYSLYQGKYYLYWGPIPAFILILIDPFTQGRVGDLYLVFHSVCGLFLLQFLIITVIWNRYFRNLPRWIFVLSILVAGLTSPWTYLLINEPNGRIYEAAISIGQFFLMAGILTMTIVFRKSTPSMLSLLWIGSLWALAIGTRLVLAVPVGMLVLTIAYRLWKTIPPSRVNVALKLISLGLPILFCFVYLGWYNWARFGSVTETGFSYALAGVNLQKYQNDLFSPTYVIQNLYNYTFKLPASMERFPFLFPEGGLKTEIFQFYSLPNVYETSSITGLLFLAPFTVFASVPIITILMKASRNPSANWIEKDRDNVFLDWIIISLLGAFVSAFSFLLIFFWAAMRYLGDFMPALTMVSLLGFWQGNQFLMQKPIYQKIYIYLGIVLAIASIVMNILLSIAVKQLGRAGF